MEFIRKALAQVQEHLRTLTASQKLAVGLLVVVIVIAFVWLFETNFVPDMVPLLPGQMLSDSERTSIVAQIGAMGVKYEIQNGQIMVRPKDRDTIIASITDVLPDDISASIDKLDSEPTMMQTAGERAFDRQRARQRTLSRVLALMPKVKSAVVLINPGGKRRMGAGARQEASASVYLSMEGRHKPSSKRVHAVAELVSKAITGLTRDRVAVIADGVAYPVPKEDSPFMTGALDQLREYETHYEENIKTMLQIPNVQVSLHVDIDMEKVRTVEEDYHKPIVKREETEERSSTSREPGGETGGRPNTGRRVENIELPGQTTEEGKSKTDFIAPRIKLVERLKDAGAIKQIRATVNVPYSYFERVYPKKTGKEAKPSPAELAQFIQSEKEEIREKVMPLIDTDDAQLVKVGEFYDEILPGEAALAADAGSGIMGQSFVQYAKPAGLAVLALSSMMMVLMMLRKASSGATLPSLEEAEHVKEPPPSLESDTGPVGEAGTTEGILHGVEVDEKTVQVRKMAEQVGDLVKEDPDAAAVLVKQWIIRDRK